MATKTPKKTRKLKTPEYKRFKFSKRIKHPEMLSSGWKLFKLSLKPLKNNWKLFGGILLVYAVLTLVFVQGLSNGFDLTQLKSTLDGSAGQLSNSITLFGMLLGSSTNNDQTASLYQSILLVIMSLTIVWTLRQVQSDATKTKPTIRDAFYKSMRPLVPFLLVLLVIGLQLLPLLIGGGIFGMIMNNGLAVGLGEQLAWSGLFFLMALWSFYMLTPTIIALFIVTLPDIAPMRAIRSARELVNYRRWTVLRKLLYLPLLVVVLLATIMLPLIIWVTPVAQWVFFALNLAIVPVVISYFYTLYKELL